MLFVPIKKLRQWRQQSKACDQGWTHSLTSIQTGPHAESEHWSRWDSTQASKRTAAPFIHIPSSSTLTIPLLDHLSSEPDSHFDAGCSQNSIGFMQLLSSQVAKMTTQLRPENFSAVLQLYGNVPPSVRSLDVSLTCRRTSGLVTLRKLQN